MLSIAKGFSTDYLTKGVAKGAENYYASAVESGTDPPGQWYGTGAAELGLHGEVDHAVLEAVYSRLQDPRDSEATLGPPHRQFKSAQQLYDAAVEAQPESTPEQRREMWGAAQSKSRQAVQFIDLTYSPVKSVTVLAVAFHQAAVDAERAGRMEEAQAWRTHHEAVEEAVMVGARAVIDYMEEVAGYSRRGNHSSGGGQFVDAHRFIVSQWFQRDSRDREPQAHVHQALLNRVLCDDGKWRSLDGAALYDHRPAAGAMGERATEEYLARVLGVRFETRRDGMAREVIGVDEAVMEMFSSRTRSVSSKMEELVSAFTAATGQPPNALERYRLSKDAVLLTRPGKSHDPETLEERLARWEQRTRAEIGKGLSSVVQSVLAARQDAGPVSDFDPEDVMDRALIRVAEAQTTWRRSDLMRAVSDCLPGHLGVSAAELRPLLDELTDRTLERAVRLTPEVDLSERPAEFLLANGGDVYSRHGSERFSAPWQMPAEQALRDAAVERGAAAVSQAEADALLTRYREHGVELGVDQAAALRGVLTSGARMELIQAAAGTGKTVVVGALAETWAAHGRAVLGLAPSQVAADVMADEGVPSVNIDRWLLQRQSGLTDGDVVVVDEAGMASTQQLVAVQERCRQAGAKMLLVGDPEQLGAVGPGGALRDLTERAVSYELGEVRRFTHSWERSASLQLRAGDKAALDAYERAGRIRGAGTQEQAEAAAVRAWLADTLEGRQSLLMAGSNEAAERMAGQARAELVRFGRVPEEGIQLGRDGNTCSAGDLVQARRNGWHLASSGVPINRATYKVQETREDGSLVVCPVVGDELGAPVTLPAEYVDRHVTLAYASTVHAGQGRTVDTAHSVIAPSASRPQTYVGMTRGRQSNTAWCVTRPTPSDAPVGSAQEVEERTGRAVLADILDRDAEQRSAMAERDALEHEARSEFSVVGQLLDGIHRSTAGQTSHLLDMLAAREVITDEQRRDLAGDEAMSAVERALRAAELAEASRELQPGEAHRTREDILDQALQGRSLAGARSPGQVLHHRIHRDLQTDHTISSYRDLIAPGVKDYHRSWLESRADDADTRRHELGAQVAEDPPAWALEALGPVPEGVVDRQGWEAKAGWAAAYREMADHTSETDPLGPAPPAGLAEKHAIWRTAHHHLDLTDRGTEEGLLSDGALRSRVAAWGREQNWAAANVRYQLADTTRAADETRVDGVLREAHGDDTALDTQAEAVVLSETAGLLDEADRARQAWWEHTTETRERAERGAAELRARGVDIDDTTGRVTAEEWLAAHRQAQAEDERGKPVDQLAEDQHDLDDAAPVDEASPETAVPDVRETSERHPSEDDDITGPAGVAEAREAVARAQEALAEIAARESLDQAADHDGYDLHNEDTFSEDADLADAWD